MTKAVISFTQKTIDNLPVPATNKNYQVYDQRQPGLALRVTSKGTKSFYVVKKLNGKTKFVYLGKYPDLTFEAARKLARVNMNRLAEGIDPTSEKRAARERGVTLEEVLDDYFSSRSNLKESTKKDYKRVMNEIFDDWRKKPIIDITEEMVRKRHKTYGDEHSRARADNGARVLRAMFNYAHSRYRNEYGNPLVTHNPTKILSLEKQWFRVDRKQTLIETHQIADWFKAVLNLRDERANGNGNADVMRDWLLVLLLTGLRHTEAASMKLDQVDLTNRSFTAIETKNSEAHQLPISDYLFEIFRRRIQMATTEYVFPAQQGGYIYDSRYYMTKIAALSGVKFTPHDLRRTFATNAELLDIPHYALKRLLNHKSIESDVTAGYLVRNVERLRTPMQRLTDHFLTLAGIRTVCLCPVCERVVQ